MGTIKTGRLGYNIVEKNLLKLDYDLYAPVLEDTKIDCIAIKDNTLYKIQIKTLQNERNTKIMPVRKISHNQGEYKIHHYTADEVDFFLGVDLATEDVYVCPISFVNMYSSSIYLSSLQPYKNNFALMEPFNGNIESGADDIGESC